MTSESCLLFCTRKMDFWLGSTPLTPQLARWRHEQNSLSALQRLELASGDDSFIEKELRAAKLWDDQFEEARTEEKRNIQIHRLIL
jgi:hypothetical protein